MYKETMCGKARCCPELTVYDETNYSIKEGGLVLWSGEL